MRRYALYFAPDAGTPLDRFGASWLGRDARTGAAIAFPEITGLPAAAIAHLTKAPRLYGFHATLKPPFALAGRCSVEALTAALAEFAEHRPAVAAPPLRLEAIGRFLALVPEVPSPALHALAADCVERFDRFRAPASADDVARRRSAGLAPRQQQFLARWGYPYVLEEFRFHLTLTGALDDADRAHATVALAPLIAPFGKTPLAVTAVSLFEQDAPSQPFRLTRRFPLTPTAAE
jgi:putative phosphonate metabolism protein